MRIAAISFLLGVCLLQGRASLAGAGALAGAAMVLVLAAGVLLARVRPPSGRLPRHQLALLLLAAAMVVAGFGWATLRAEWRLADELSGAREGVDLVVVGRIASLPQAVGNGWRFILDIEPAEAGIPRRVLLSWYGERGQAVALPAPRAGERWRLVVRLKRPHGFANPHGFDYEAWLLERGIRATGHVRGEAHRLDDAPQALMQWVHRLRGAVRERMLASLAEAPHAGIVLALAVGDQRSIPHADWEVFRRTGIGHLVAISGLHVALVGLFCGGMVGTAWRRIPALALRLPAQKARALAALAGATAYALLAGMGVPVLRAWLMLAVAVIALLSGRAQAPSRVLAIALLVVVAIDPWAVLAAGFWLSFGAVAVILAVLGGRVAPPRGWRAALRIQLAISLALAPLLLVLFNAFPLVSPLANLVAIPLVSFVIAPLVLLGVIVPVDAVLVLAHAATALMMSWVRPLAALELALWEQAQPPTWLLAGGLTAVGALLLPRATPGRLAAPALLAAMLLWEAPRPAEGAFRVRVLDVGQGLAVHVQTRAHDLVFDAGPPYGSEADAGSRVILPYLRAIGVRRLDHLVLSHEDSDHVGGAASLLRALPVDTVLAGRPEAGSRWWPALKASTVVQPCAAGQKWTRDGVRFDMLHPRGDAAPSASRRHDNDGSCVLRVSAASGTLLLTGDIGVGAEARLLAADPAALESTVVVSPHHGSRSSSSAAFVDATLAAHVVHSAGHRNPFGHPHPQVWARWAEAGTRNWRTDSQGAIEADFDADADAGVTLRAQRVERPRYWHGR